ncbi:acyltransferase [Desulfosarcina alkanivorans]|uniref:Acyltransferase n=1 Tax=Desulfosarcina alkanivorans TaxID=571177 RepID=A0A5K7YN95_9BACT|nr:lysophospholipid acyltransferase family protein [Desulfosarcina alkanivorans]BBO68371.1 acyltransferase [Desulfosarcina alkanivorans]
MQMTTTGKLIDLQRRFSLPVPRPVSDWTCRPVERLLAIDRINAIHDRLMQSPATGDAFNRLLQLLGTTYLIGSDDLAKIPGHGPLVVVANHPFGGIEGIILGDLMQRVRPDTKILGNYLLGQIGPISDSIIPVDPFGRASSVASNAGGFRSCLRWLKKGNCLVTFPAGEVAHYCHGKRRVVDPPWSSHVAALVRMSGARVLPVFFPGRNSILFNLMGLIHPRLRTVMLGRELVARQASRVRLFVGAGIPPARMKAFPKDQALIRWLRFRTYFLANRMEKNDRSVIREKKQVRIKKETPEALIPPVPGALLAAEVAALPENARLVAHKHLSVFIADSERIPHLLREIGRLREKTFREVGEGTGRSMDVDLFDSYYRHLILWNTDKSEVVGAYRIGDTRAVLSRFGPKGLYTHSLFRFKPGLLRYLSDSLELGRSFIRSTYQRQPNCLALLWKGIGAYLVRHPEYRILFGPVSISDSYHRVSKQIMIRFLKKSCTSGKLSAQVTPRCPVRLSAGGRLSDLDARLSTGSIDDVSMMISEIESDGKRVPVLVKHYLKMNGQFVAFNVDRDFGHAIDGLVVVDLMKTKTRLLERFMGVDGCASYRGYWAEGREQRSEG